jgi:hypothetical protein
LPLGIAAALTFCDRLWIREYAVAPGCMANDNLGAK